MENDEFEQGLNINEREINASNYFKLDYINQKKIHLRIIENGKIQCLKNMVKMLNYLNEH